MKTLFTAMLVLALILSPVLAGNNVSRAAAGLPNPVHEATEQEATEKTGVVGIFLPEGATEARYSYIDMPEGKPLFQVDFMWEGVPCAYRAQAAAQLDDISGIYDDWDHAIKLLIGNSSAQVRYNPGAAGVALWFDVLNDQIFCAMMKEGASMVQLLQLSYPIANWDQELPDESNPIPFAFMAGYQHEASAEKISEALKMDFKAPADAQGVAYFLVGAEDLNSEEIPPVGAVYYKLGEKAYMFYARKGSEAFDPSGKIAPWVSYETVELGKYSADVMISEDGLGVITWFDQEQGINRSVAMETGADAAALIAAAQPFL